MGMKREIENRGDEIRMFILFIDLQRLYYFIFIKRIPIIL